MPKTLRGSFEQALRPLPYVVKGVQACRLPGLKCLKRCAAASSRHSGHCPLLLMPKTVRGRFEQALRPLPSVVKGVQACRLPDLKTLRDSFEQALRPLPSVVKGVQACRLPGPQMPQTLRGSFEQALRPLPYVVKGVQACRLPGHCPLLLRTFKPAVCQASNASNAGRQLRAGTQATALCC